MLGLVRPFWVDTIAGGALGLVGAAVGMIAPYLSKVYFDTVYPTRDSSLLTVLAVGGFVLTTASLSMGAVRSYYAQAVGARVGMATNLLLFNHLQNLPVRFFDGHRVGEMMSRFGDMRSSVNSVNAMFQTIVGSGALLVVVPPVLFLLNWRLALVSMLSVPLTAAVSALSGSMIRKCWMTSAEASADVSAFQVEALSNIRTAKALSVEPHVFSQMQLRARTLVSAQLRANSVAVTIGAVNGLLKAVGSAFFSWYAWTLIISDQLSLGEFVAFSAYLGYMVGPANQFAGLFSEFQRTAVSLNRMFEYLDLAPEQDPVVTQKPYPPVARARGELRLEEVSLSYFSGREVLNKVSLHVLPGTVTAIVGASGSGKSSLLRVLCRVCEPDVGNVFLDGVKASEYSLSEFRRQISVVWQDTGVVSGSLWENLTYGIAESQLGLAERVNEAVRLCRLDALVAQLPSGYETVLSESGTTLSGGEKQRLAIARALIRDTPVLVLDEATSQIDLETEEIILREVFSARRDTSVVFVTHRVASAARADQVCVLADGCVQAVGPHDEMVESCAPYRRLLAALDAKDVPSRDQEPVDLF